MANRSPPNTASGSASTSAPVPIPHLPLHTTLSNGSGSSSTVRGGGADMDSSPSSLNGFESPPRSASSLGAGPSANAGAGAGGMSTLERTTSAPPLSSNLAFAFGAGASQSPTTATPATGTRPSTSPPTRGTPLPSSSARSDSRPRANTAAARSTPSSSTTPHTTSTHPNLFAPSPSLRPHLPLAAPRRSPAPSPSPTPTSLLSHLYLTGLLQSSLSDLHLIAFDTYYKLHKLVLGQSIFFKTLLSGGWGEESKNSFTTLEIEMEKPFTRVAFEFCLVVLYGGEVELRPPVWARTTTNAPLGLGWERIWERVVLGLRKNDLEQVGGGAPGRGEEDEDDAERNEVHGRQVQEATPEFLLSLLSVATYLEMPRVQAHALALIQSTMTPWTIGTYLAFALGKGLGNVSAGSPLNGPLVGLESVGTPYVRPPPTITSTTPPTATTTIDTTSDSPTSPPPRSRATSHAESTPPTHSEVGEETLEEVHRDEDEEEETTFVGPEGERVGQACACWLAKWGSEILAVEEFLFTSSTITSAETEEKELILSQAFGGRNLPQMRVWSSLEGGIPASWVRGVISSDAFFLGPSGIVGNELRDEEGVLSGIGEGRVDGQQLGNGEFERYLFAKRVVELRRKEKKREKAVKRARERNERRSEKEREREESATLASSSSFIGGTADSRDPSVYELAGELPATPRMDFEDDFDLEDEEDGEREWEAEQCEEKVGDWECKGGVRDESEEEEGDSEDGDEKEDRDERDYDELFKDAIHYSHMTYPRLSFISQDISPTTGRPYVPLTTIQQALWSSTAFLNRIPIVPLPHSNISHSLYSAAAQSRMTDQNGNVRDGDALALDLPAGTGTELGLSVTIDAKLQEGKKSRGFQRKTFYLVPVDDTSRLNDGPLPGSDIDPSSFLSTSISHSAQSGTTLPPKISKTPSMPLGPQGFFGLALETRMGIRNSVFGTEEEMQLGRRFVEFEPMRFCAEFWGVEELRDKQRLYSQTFFYAGSYYNLYLQKIQKKGVQLGIYLHRQNQLETFPAASRPPVNSSTPPALLAQVAARLGSAPAPTGPNAAPYVDRRKAIKAFFSIWCPNQLGTSMTKFSSGPDSFALSQSWGWKSSSLSSEYITQQSEINQVGTIDPTGQLGGRFKGLRVALVMGIV